MFQKIPTGNVLEDPLGNVLKHSLGNVLEDTQTSGRGAIPLGESSRTFPQIFCGRGRGVPPVYLKKTPLASGRGRGCAQGKGGGGLTETQP